MIKTKCCKTSLFVLEEMDFVVDLRSYAWYKCNIWVNIIRIMIPLLEIWNLFLCVVKILRNWWFNIAIGSLFDYLPFSLIILCFFIVDWTIFCPYYLILFGQKDKEKVRSVFRRRVFHEFNRSTISWIVHYLNNHYKTLRVSLITLWRKKGKSNLSSQNWGSKAWHHK